MSVLLRRYYQLLNNSFGYWLKSASRRAIIVAFGVSDGLAVIFATNDFLSVLAATDRTKAQALAGFINEDPMMVCSLGLQPQRVTMPIRWLVGDGNSWIDIGCKGNLNTTMEMQAVQVAETTNKVTALFGDNTTGSAAITIYTPTTGGTSRNTRFGSTYFSNTATQTIGSVLNYKQNKTNLTINDTVVGSYNATASFTTSANLALFKTNYATSEYYNAEAWISKFKLGGDYLREMYPFIRKINGVDVCGMIDVLSGTFYQNAGSGQFTEEFGYMQNGQLVPWTPSQIP